MSEKTTTKLSRPADPRRLKAEEATAAAKRAIDDPPEEVTLQILYDRQQMILEQNAWIIAQLKNRN